MMKTFTENDFILYYYDEMSPNNRTQFEAELITNNVLAEQYSQYLQTFHTLESIEFEPSNETVKKIKEYSRNMNVHA